MTEIYDYVYAHVLRRPVEVSSYETTAEDSNCVFPCPEEVYSYETTTDETNSESEVNTADFSPRDLQMFVDSLEVIARLAHDKENGQSKRKIKKPTSTPKRRQITCLDSSTCESLDEDDVNSFSNLSMSSSSEYLYDETYFGLPYCVQSTALLYSNLMSNTLPETTGTVESSVFDNTTFGRQLYENSEPLRPRSKIAPFSKRKSLKSQIISLFLKKQHVKPQKPIEDILSSTTIGEQKEAKMMYDSILGAVIKQKLESKKSKKNKKISSGKKSEKNIFSKAIRMLTL